jgi:group I intron endonuclease
MGYLYKLTNKVNGKSYIGQTIRPIEKRFEEHQRPDSHCVALCSAIKKYGWDNFEKDYYECPDEDLNKHEKLIIEVLETLSPNGYNLKEGGDNGKHIAETIQKISEAKLGEKNPMYGKKHSDDSNKKRSEALTGENNPNSKKVYQYDLYGNYIGSFGSGGEAARALCKNSGSSAISECANRKRKTAYGFKWSFELH